MADDVRLSDDLPADLASLAARLRSEAASLSAAYPAAAVSEAPPDDPPAAPLRHRRAKRLGGWAAAAVACALVASSVWRQPVERRGVLDGAPSRGQEASRITQAGPASAQGEFVAPPVEWTPAGIRGFTGAEREAVLDLLEAERSDDSLSI